MSATAAASAVVAAKKRAQQGQDIPLAAGATTRAATGAPKAALAKKGRTAAHAARGARARAPRGGAAATKAFIAGCRGGWRAA